jgi:hypothetical protein
MAGASLIAEGRKTVKRKTSIFVSNRQEGNALQTINALREAALAG